MVKIINHNYTPRKSCLFKISNMGNWFNLCVAENQKKNVINLVFFREYIVIFTSQL